MGKPSNVVRLDSDMRNWVGDQRRIDQARIQNKENAVKLAKANIPVFLVNTRSKRPFIPAWDRLDTDMTEAEREHERRTFHDKHGFAPMHVGATLNRAKVREMFRDNPDALPAISCGPAGLIVVDNDIKERDGTLRNGVELFDAFCEAHGGIPAGAIAVPSRSSGRHLYFKNSDNRGCSAGRLKKDCETDVKGVGGYVIAPASIRIHDGKRYGSSQELDALISAHKAGKLAPMPQFVVDAIGAKPERESDAVSEREVQSAIAALRVAELPDGHDLVDPTKGGFDLDDIASRYPKLKEALDSANRSEIRFNLAIALRTERPSITDAEYAAILLARDDVGEFVDDERPSPDGGEYNWRNIVRDLRRAVPHIKPEDKGTSKGNAFGNVDEAEAEDERAANDATASRRAALIEHFEGAIASADLDGNATLAKALEAELKKAQRAAAKDGVSKRDHVNLVDLLAEPEEYTAWVVKHVLATHSTMIVAGLWGAGKTAVMVDMALHIAHGMPWRGQRVQKGVVLYAALENPKDVKSRVRAWCKAHHVDFDPSFVAYTGKCTLFDPDNKATQGERRLIELANETAQRLNLPVALVIIDTVSQAIIPGSDREHGSLFVASMQRIADATGACVAALHHPTKAGDEVRGDGAFQGNVDGIILLKRDVKTGLGSIKASPQKFRVGDPRKVNFGYRLTPVVVGKDEDNEDRTVIVATEAAADISWQVDESEDHEQNIPPAPDTPNDRPVALLRVIRERAELIASNTGDAPESVELPNGEVLKLWNIDRKRSGLPEIADPAICSRLLAKLVDANALARVGDTKRSTAYKLAPEKK